jgi:Bacterial pullanase-associated domain
MKRRLICTAAVLAAITLGLGTPLARAQASPEVAKTPEGMVSIHYFRPNGDYDGRGTHLWESFEKVENGKIVAPKDKSDMPIMSISWSSPMKPTGKDGFGVYWQVKANEFRNGKYNYIIHKGDSKDCAKDSVWFNTQGNSIFINQGDCVAYFSAEDAIKARK